ncbi:MAG: HPr family phosphocarrier protein [Firmicutes bacterium]|uniref:Phosphocarrier protein HPr n=1 Tax=Melghirimyces thermohalophilus TaxID=1236220 RepID=A0A1G6I942_9BACL|nr:HPr family phosphocarrier protein [Melghirimyces thermohalophilus]MDA8351625.1 HPr family phosphocarrier protein [Bacillota bacterium]SDC02535.1 phosphocarrier protein [Melghirimyces thermohalophilus]
MYEETLTISNETGLHARPAALLVKEAGKFECSIKLVKEGKEVDAKSLLGVMSLSVRQGEEITLRAEGDDAEQAVKTLRQLIESGLGE